MQYLPNYWNSGHIVDSYITYLYVIIYITLKMLSILRDAANGAPYILYILIDFALAISKIYQMSTKILFYFPWVVLLVLYCVVSIALVEIEIPTLSNTE